VSSTDEKKIDNGKKKTMIYHAKKKGKKKRQLVGPRGSKKNYELEGRKEHTDESKPWSGPPGVLEGGQNCLTPGKNL